MRQSPTFVAGREREYPPRTDLFLNRVQSSPPTATDDDLRLARASGANVLLIGHDPQVSDAAAYVADSPVGAAATTWTPDGLCRPRRASQDDIVLARCLDRFGPDTQHELRHWLTVVGFETRVISTASPSLWTMVREGAFSPELYYRLNTVCLRLA